MMNAFREICSEDGFEEFLEATLTRIGDIESLGRTREITIKDLWNDGKYRINITDAKNKAAGSWTFQVEPNEKDDDDE